MVYSRCMVKKWILYHYWNGRSLGTTSTILYYTHFVSRVTDRVPSQDLFNQVEYVQDVQVKIFIIIVNGKYTMHDNTRCTVLIMVYIRNKDLIIKDRGKSYHDDTLTYTERF